MRRLRCSCCTAQRPSCLPAALIPPAAALPAPSPPQAVVPLLLATMASAAQVQAAHESSSRQQVEGTELRQLGRQQRARPPHVARPPPLSAWLAVAALLAAAVARPSLLAAPYMLAAAAAVWRWSGGGSGLGASSAASALQSYTGAYAVALYLWQAALSGWAVLQPAARVLGLFSLTAAQGWPELAAGVLQLAAMLLLFLSVGDAGSGRQRQGEAHPGAVAARGDGDDTGEHTPLLQPDTAPPGVAPRAPPAAPAISLHQLLYLLLLDTAEALCQSPAVVAALLCSACLVQPSALGALVLLWGLAALLARPAAAALQCSSRALTCFLLVSGEAGCQRCMWPLWRACCACVSDTCCIIFLPRRPGCSAATSPLWQRRR